MDMGRLWCPGQHEMRGKKKEEKHPFSAKKPAKTDWAFGQFPSSQKGFSGLVSIWPVSKIYDEPSAAILSVLEAFWRGWDDPGCGI